MDRGEEAKKAILAGHPKALIDVMVLDLSNLKSIKEFAETFKANYKQLDILLNNAGIMWTDYGKTTDGFEQQVGVNHLGHFALTAQLFDLIKATKESRIVNISSVGHRSGVMDFDNFLFEGGKDYTPMNAYGRSKLCNLLFTYELQRRVAKEGLDVKVLAAHPGGSNTNLSRHVTGKVWYVLLNPLIKALMQNAFMGSLPGVRASLDPQVKGGTYFGPSGFGELRGNPVPVQSNEASHNEKDAKRLWDISQTLTGLEFKL